MYGSPRSPHAALPRRLAPTIPGMRWLALRATGPGIWFAARIKRVFGCAPRGLSRSRALCQPRLPAEHHDPPTRGGYIGGPQSSRPTVALDTDPQSGPDTRNGLKRSLALGGLARVAGCRGWCCPLAPRATQCPRRGGGRGVSDYGFQTIGHSRWLLVLWYRREIIMGILLELRYSLSFLVCMGCCRRYRQGPSSGIRISVALTLGFQFIFRPPARRRRAFSARRRYRHSSSDRNRTHTLSTGTG